MTESRKAKSRKNDDDPDLTFQMMRPEGRLFAGPMRFFRYYRKSADGRRNFLVRSDVQMLLDQYLTVDPETGKPIDLSKEAVIRETNARHLREYAGATAEILDDPPEVALAWLERLRATTTWMDTPELRKTRGKSIFFSFAGIFVSLTGSYPDQIESLGIHFTKASHAGFLLALIAVIWYSWASVRILVRNYLIEDTLLELEQKIKRTFKDYDNRWNKYIYWQYLEKNFFYNRVLNWIAYLSIVCLFISVARTLGAK